MRRFELRFREADPETADLARSVIRNDLPRFLDRVVATVSSGGRPSTSGPSLESAGVHGKQRQDLGIDIQSLVREYGILRDVVIEILVEQDQRFDVAEFRTWSSKISEAACEAVAQYARQRDDELAIARSNDLAFLAHELRNQATIALVTLSLAKQQPQASSSTLDALGETLRTLNEILDREITSARLRAVDAGVALQREAIDVAALAKVVVTSVESLAAARAIAIAVHGDATTVNADRRLLVSALSNLVTNAIKFSCEGGRITIRTRSMPTSVTLEVEDQCGGLGPAAMARISAPWVQAGKDRSGFGLGVAIARRAVEAHDGSLDVRDLPGIGCSFTIDLPRTSP